ncbi:MAG: sulfotransferase domain-containing protein [bacterium]
MAAKVLHIKRKLNIAAESLVNVHNFRYQEGESVDSGIIVNNPNLSLYCLDDSKGRAIFVEVPPDIDLSEAPFYYQAQFQHALRLIAVPYEDFHQLAKEAGDPFGTLVLIYSVGRCGSTLLSKVFNRLPEVISLSEPDVFTQIVTLRNPDGSRDRDLAELLLSCTRFLVNPASGIRIPCLVVKFRSFVIEIGDLIYSMFPQARIIFLYRNAEDVVESLIRAFGPLGVWGWMLRAGKTSVMARFLLRVFVARRKKMLSRLIPLIRNYPSRIYTDFGSMGLLLIMWLSVMHRYLLFYRQGIPMVSLRYEDLIANPQEMVKSLFEYCGLPICDVSQACRAFEQDAQLGTRLARKPPGQRYLDMKDLLKMYHLLKSHPDVQTPYFVAPGTLTVE